MSVSAAAAERVTNGKVLLQVANRLSGKYDKELAAAILKAAAKLENGALKDAIKVTVACSKV